MECLEIDWKNIDDTFVRDEFYETIQAPKWIDFNAPEQPVDAHEWFCGDVGCLQEEQPLCRAPPSILITAPEPQEISESLPSPQVPIAVLVAVAPMAEKLVSASTGKRARGLVSTSLPSLPDTKADNFVKSKALYHTRMPPIAERKGQALRRTLRHACENEHPRQLCKAQEGLQKAVTSSVQEGVVKKIKRLEQKDTGKEVKANVIGREVQARVFKEVSSISEHRVLRGVSKVSRSVTSLERRIFSQGRSIVCKSVVKEHFADVSNVCSDTKKPEEPRAPQSGPSSRLVVRHSPFMSSSSIVPSKKIDVVSQSLTSASLKNESRALSRPPRIVGRKETRSGAYPIATTTKLHPHSTLVPLPGELKRNDPAWKNNKIAAETTPLYEELHSLEVRQEQLLPETEIRSMGVGQKTPMESQPYRHFPFEAMLLEQGPEMLFKGEDNSIGKTKVLEEKQCPNTEKQGPEMLFKGEDNFIGKTKVLEEKQCLNTENEVLTQQFSMGKPLSQERSERSEEVNSLVVRQEQLLTEKEILADSGEQDKYQQTLMKESQPNQEFPVETTLFNQNPQVLAKDDDISFVRTKALEEKQCPGMENKVQVFIGKPLSSGEIVRTEEEDPQNKIRMDKDLEQHTLEDFLRNLHLATPEDDSGNLVSDNLRDCKAELEMVVSMRCSSQSTASSQLSKPSSSSSESYAMSVVSHGSSSIETTGQKAALEINEDKGKTITCTKHSKQKLHLPCRQSSQGKKRKSSELNFHIDCSGKYHIASTEKAISTIPPVNSSVSMQFESSSARCTAAALSQICSDSCKGEQHKKMRTTVVHSFKPFRLRTEERSALKELGLGKKEVEPPTAQEIVHHALRMPSFGHPFVPQRSTKKLTVPKEPKFHPSRTRKTCAKHAVILAL